MILTGSVQESRDEAPKSQILDAISTSTALSH
jgi:hypothetical protein